MKAWRVILVAVVLFVAGAAAGGAATHLLYKQRPFPRSQPGPLPWEAQRGALLRLMQRELELTRDQQQQARRILEESRERTTRDLRRESQWVREELAQILTPDQRRRLAEIQRNRPPRRPEGGPRDDPRRPEPRRFRGPPNATNPPPPDPAPPQGPVQK